MGFIFSRKGTNILAGVTCFALIAFSFFYFEKREFLIPCPLCYAQRIVLGFVGFWFLIAAIFPAGRRGGKIHGALLFLFSCLGAALSIRHLYLQNLPKGSSQAACGQDFYALVENSPIADIVEAMVFGTGECGDVQWELLGLSIPGWTLIAFIGVGCWGLFHNAFRD